MVYHSRAVRALTTLLFIAGCLPALAAERRIENLRPIPLHPGVNTIGRFAPDGRDAIVAQGWRENGNAHGYTVLLVLISDGNGRFVVVPFERPGATRGSSDLIVDDPHTGEDAVRSVRLARALVDGSQATLLLSATREVDLSQGLTAPSPVTYDVFRLVHESSEVGGSPDTFKLLQTSRSVSRFCSADVALHQQFKLALPDGFSGPRTPDGC